MSQRNLTTALCTLVGLCIQAAAWGQLPVGAIPQPQAVPYAPAAYAENVPSPAQVPAVPGTDAAQPSGGTAAAAQEKGDGEKKEGEKKDEEKEPKEQWFNLHAQATIVAQGDPPFSANYSGPNSLNPAGERQNTLAADLFVGMRLWQGAEVHADALMWEGHGLSDTFGIEDFTNGDAYKAGTDIPDFMFAHLLVRQTFGFGGEQEDVPDGALTLAGKQDVSRLTVTVGRFTPTDMFDNNTYAKDPHTQFLNWAACSMLTWDFPSDSVGYTTGISMELNQPDWALRYGFFQMPGTENGFTADDRIFKWPSEGSGGSFGNYSGLLTNPRIMQFALRFEF